MFVCQYTFYVDLYETAVFVERTMKEKNDYFNEQCGIKRKGDQRENFHLQGVYKRLPGATMITIMHVEASNLTIGLGNLQCPWQAGTL